MQVDLWMCICGWTCSGCCFSFVDCFSIIKFFTYGGGGGSQMFELNREFYKNSTFLSMLISTTSSSTDFILQGWNTVTYQNSCVDFVQNMLAWVSTV